ncbi:MAG: homoserine kinase [Azospirillaceae bacterium]
MAVYTEVDDAALEALVAEYDLGRLLSCKGIAEGVENSNFLLVTEAGPHILTLYEKRVKAEDLPFFLGLMQHLAARGFICPTPIAGRDGRALRHVAGRPAAIISFLRGVWPRRPTAVHCAGVGAAMADLHRCATDFGLRRANDLSLAGWGNLLRSCQSQADAFSPGLSAELTRELEALQAAWPDPAALPRGVIHADMFPDNVFFLENRLSGVIDFYFACNDMLAYDLAVALTAWCFERDGAFNVTKGRALLEAYVRSRPLTVAERDALPLLARGAALRFLLTRLYDWLNQVPGAMVKPKDPTEYLQKMRFHREVANAAGYGLEYAP